MASLLPYRMQRFPVTLGTRHIPQDKIILGGRPWFIVRISLNHIENPIPDEEHETCAMAQLGMNSDDIPKMKVQPGYSRMIDRNADIREKPYAREGAANDGTAIQLLAPLCKPRFIA